MFLVVPREERDGASNVRADKFEAPRTETSIPEESRAEEGGEVVEIQRGRRRRSGDLVDRKSVV